MRKRRQEVDEAQECMSLYDQCLTTLQVQPWECTNLPPQGIYREIGGFRSILIVCGRKQDKSDLTKVKLVFSDSGKVYVMVRDWKNSVDFMFQRLPKVRTLQILAEALIRNGSDFDGAIHIVGLVATPLISGYLCN